MKVVLDHCTIERRGLETITTFPDGTSCAAWPHYDGHYHVISHRLGYGDDLARYCFEHEVAHAWVAQHRDAAPSCVLWCLAHDLECHPDAALAEEMLAQTVQRHARAGEEPILSDVDWQGLRDGFLRLVL